MDAAVVGVKRRAVSRCSAQDLKKTQSRESSFRHRERQRLDTYYRREQCCMAMRTPSTADTGPKNHCARHRNSGFHALLACLPHIFRHTSAPRPRTHRAQRQFPPAGVLGALRVALTILDDADDASSTGGVAGGSGGDRGGSGGTDMVTFRTALGRTVRAAVSAPDLTWEMAARVLGRPFRCSVVCCGGHSPRLSLVLTGPTTGYG